MSDVPSSRDRRQFLAMSSVVGFVVAAHPHLAWAETLLEDPPMPGARTGPRILRLRLSTAAPLSKMKEFYGETLGLPLRSEGENEITIGCGSTPITFESAGPESADPFYHFAFNIPENRILQARDWQLERTELLPVFPHLRDPDYPNDVVHFSHWNAHSVFFLDPAGNVVEYIARHDLDNASLDPFSTNDILYASEIAFTVDDVPTAAAGLRERCALSQYGQGSEAFSALGDEHGLLLVFRRGRNLSLGSGEPRPADVFPVDAEIRSEKTTRYAIPDYPYKISMG